MRQRASDDERLPAQAVIRAARQRPGIESAHRLRATALPRCGFADLKRWCQLQLLRPECRIASRNNAQMLHTENLSSDSARSLQNEHGREVNS